MEKRRLSVRTIAIMKHSMVVRAAGAECAKCFHHMIAEERGVRVGEVVRRPGPVERPVVRTSKVQPSAMYIKHILSLIKVYVDFPVEPST